MATRKPGWLLLFMAVIMAAYFLCAIAVHLPRSEGLHGRRLLLQTTGKVSLRPTHTFIEPRPRHAYATRSLASHPKVRKMTSETTSAEYGPPERNPPIHQDPPTPFTMKTVSESESSKIEYIHLDYPPLGPHSQDFPPDDTMETGNSHTDYMPVVPHPPNGYHDYPPPRSEDESAR